MRVKASVIDILSSLIEINAILNNSGLQSSVRIENLAGFHGQIIMTIEFSNGKKLNLQGNYNEIHTFLIGIVAGFALRLPK
jgi:hypothetical protein